MLYRKFGKTNEMVSILGFGCMRLPLLPGGNFSNIDEKYAAELIRFAIDEGVNYIDTAYPYHGSGMGSAGQSEPFVGKVLKDGYRQKVNIATKLPSWLVKTRSDMDKFLNEQLKRLGTDTIDFYLVHALNTTLWKNVKEAGVAGFLDQAIRDGRIKYAGFSYHEEEEFFNDIVDGYDWSFCQIQYNYMDEEFQAGRKGLNYAAQKGLGLTIMEPLKGGKLAVNIPADVQSVFDQDDNKMTPAEWALRWVWDHPEVSTLLSGMNSREQVAENIKIAGNAEENSLTAKDKDVIEQVKNVFRQKIKVDCTSCSYCMPCEQGVNIPGCFNFYNNYYMFGREESYRMLPPGQRASNCIECGDCENKCPQSIKIREELQNVKAIFEAA
jgi:predicted aldo/keto reductase-like oxidoreductase